MMMRLWVLISDVILRSPDLRRCKGCLASCHLRFVSNSCHFFPGPRMVAHR
jgi:hypothetical protein